MKSPCFISAYAFVYLLLLNPLIYFHKNLYELYTVRGPQHSMTYFSTMSTMENLCCKVEATLTPLWVLK